MTSMRNVVLAALLLGACGDDDGGSTPKPDAGGGGMADAGGGGMADAGGGGMADAAVAQCLAPTTFGTATLMEQYAEQNLNMMTNTPDNMYLQAKLNDDAAFDVFVVELYKGFGAFKMGEIAPGTYQITGEELNYATCGVCIRVLTDVAGGMASDSGYLATAGTVTITSVKPNLAGTVSGVTLEHVNIMQGTFQSSPHPDMCMSAIESASFDVMIAM